MEPDERSNPDLAALVETDWDTDTLFEVLSDRRRRYVVDCLQERSAPLPLADVADEVAVRENGVPVTEISAEEVKSIYMDLYHVHVPKMEDAGLVEYDQERDLVALHEKAETLPIV